MSCKVTQGNGLMKAASWKKDLGCSVQAELRNRPEAGRGVWLGPGREAGTEAVPSPCLSRLSVHSAFSWSKGLGEAPHQKP